MSRVLTTLACAAAFLAAAPAAVDAKAHKRQHHKHRHHHKQRRHRSCDPAYKGACLRPDVSDYDCQGGSGNGPYYVRGPIRVVGNDHYRLDADRDGIACES